MKTYSVGNIVEFLSFDFNKAATLLLVGRIVHIEDGRYLISVEENGEELIDYVHHHSIVKLWSCDDLIEELCSI